MKEAWIRPALLGTALALSLTSGAVGADLPFSDVSPGAWFYDGVQYVYEHHLMLGTGETLFSPDTVTTRGMVVTLLHRLEGVPEPEKTAAFADVAPGSYYEKAVAWAASREIVNGYTTQYFAPDDPITREQLTAILYRYCASRGIPTPQRAQLETYTDYGTVSSYAAESISWANAVGLIKGTSENTLSPEKNTTRAQVAVILMRLCEHPELEITKRNCAVVFELNYPGNGTGPTAIVPAGETVHAPADPVRPGFRFSGWYDDPINGTRFSFQTAVDRSMTLYAHWEPDSSSGGTGHSGENNGQELQPGIRKNEFAVFAERGEDGRSVVLTLKLQGQVELAGFDLQLHYDSNRFTLTDLQTEQDLQIVANGNEPGTIFFNYSGVENLTTPQTVLTAAFSDVSPAAGGGEFTLEAVEVIRVDPEHGYAIEKVPYCLIPGSLGAGEVGAG